MKITMQHIRSAGGCEWGLREFFKRYNLDIKAFIKEGYIDSSKLLATNDELATRIVEKAMNREFRNNKGAQ